MLGLGFTSRGRAGGAALGNKQLPISFGGLLQVQGSGSRPDLEASRLS